MQANQNGLGADFTYRDWFAQAAGRQVQDGPPSVGMQQPELPEGLPHMTDLGWALGWLRRGGYRDAQQQDEHGWTALHHAIQATAHLEIAACVCRGLIEMMSPTGLRAKTWGGRPRGYSVLHMAANGSDLRFERANLVRLLIEKDADMEAVDDEGRTLFLLACGTGVVDVAQALSQAGCSVWAMSTDGRNAVDHCRSNSGIMRWSFMESFSFISL